MRSFSIAKCDGPDQFENFDRMFRSVISLPEAVIKKRENNWKRRRAKKEKSS